MDTLNDPETPEGAETGETMESLLAQQAAVSQKLAGKQVAWVKVIAVTKDQVLVDIGEKNEGVVPLSEFTGDPNAKGGPTGQAPAVGQRIPVLKGGHRGGTAQLSYKRARAELGWEAAVKAHADKARVRGRVTSSIKGGFLVDVGGVTGFLPASLADLRPVRQPERMVGTGVRCYILEVNEGKRQVVLSRKAVLEEEVSKKRDSVLKELRVGEIRIGRVVSTSAAGIVVDIGGAEGFVRAADIAWGAVQEPKADLRGTKIRVKVLAKPENERPQLGMKQLLANPADAVRKKYPPKTVVKGKVLEAGPNGVRIELEGKEKTIAVSSPAESDPETAYKPGDPVAAVVIGVNPSTFEVSVSINKYTEIRDRKRLAQYLKAPPPLTLGQLLSPDKGE